MKNQLLLLVLSIFSFNLIGQSDSTGLPGDNFNLEGALDLFKQANSPEEFEKLLNTESNQVNNLDLNDDGQIDYVTVLGKTEGEAQLFVLQVHLSERERQDIAVIEIEKKGSNVANIQIIGDEDIFGDEKIVEPSDGSPYNEADDEESGPSPSGFIQPAVIINVWAWPCVRFAYAPGYIAWTSPWRWGIYPGWWKPWRPLRWAAWHPLRARYYGPSVRVVHTHRLAIAHKAYRPVRVHSTTVRTRYAGAHKNYTVTKKRTTVTGPRGNKVTKSKTTVRGPQGHVKAQKTTVRRARR